ncbi:MAG: hypothetical protein HKN25_10360, partial [Pyrinomonadaceae bacterium]|nr:hypothetical protein [Pyrinomonadaceae bacterium]
IRNCQSSGAAFSINTNRTVRYVEFNTNGNDAFYIDDWRLYLNGRQIKRGGTNNARGWCLSTDPNDAGGLWRPFVSGRCRTRIRFPITSVPTPPTTGNQVYRVTVDCYHSKIRFTDTTNRITVAFLDAGRNVIRRVSKSGIRNCSGSEAAFSIRTNRRVRYIEFSTNGNDGFFIDEWRLFLDGRQIQHLGVDDGRGWCLSTDPGDAGGPWSGFVTGGCKSRLRFL